VPTPRRGRLRLWPRWRFGTPRQDDHGGSGFVGLLADRDRKERFETFATSSALGDTRRQVSAGCARGGVSHGDWVHHEAAGRDRGCQTSRGQAMGRRRHGQSTKRMRAHDGNDITSLLRAGSGRRADVHDRPGARVAAPRARKVAIAASFGRAGRTKPASTIGDMARRCEGCGSEARTSSGQSRDDVRTESPAEGSLGHASSRSTTSSVSSLRP
jgi:hypothetical protein